MPFTLTEIPDKTVILNLEFLAASIAANYNSGCPLIASAETTFPNSLIKT